MMSSHPLKLHLVAFDIPFPPDYGGAIDVFYQIKNLSEAGVAIYLHCPQYGGRVPAPTLEALCARVWYYPRKTGLAGISVKYPYMVCSRRHPDMLHNLVQVEAPILFDGVSTAYYMDHPALRNRLKIMRNQNVEQDYYRLLADREENLLKRMYYRIESALLRRYENRLQAADAFFTVALHDHAFFRDKYPAAVHEYIPSFQPYQEVRSALGTGSFCLYHGNLGLAENREAAKFLLQEVIPGLDVRFVIAGRNPDDELKLLAEKAGAELIANPDMDQMNELIHGAQVHVLPTFQNTGLKLKLLHALFNGRHVLVNEAMVHGTGLADICEVAADGTGFRSAIKKLMSEDFGAAAVKRRSDVLLQHYNNKKNTERIITFLQQRSR